MTQTELRTLEWFGEQGVEIDSLTFQPRRSPDFLGRDGRSWEVKLARDGQVFFSFEQSSTLRPDCMVVVWPAVDAPEPDVFAFGDFQREERVIGKHGAYRFNRLPHRNAINILLTDDEYTSLVAAARFEDRPMAWVVRKGLLPLLDAYDASGRYER